MKNIILTGGGTAGHVTPNIALIPLLKDAGYQIYYVGSKNGIEKNLIKQINTVKYYEIPSGKLRRYFSFKNFIDPFKIIAGIFKSLSIVKKVNPHVCFSKGGFVSVPVVLACALKKIPIVIHESDITPGLANRISQKYCKVMCTTFPEAAKAAGAKAIVTGSPIRPEILNGDKIRGMILCGFEKGRPVLLIMGGSSGAKTLNEAVDSILDLLIEKFQVIHIRGEGNTKPELDLKAGYQQYAYVKEELPHLMAAADLFLSRAGANAIFEFAALSKPMLLIPLPTNASRGDQTRNANSFEEKGWAKVLLQENMNDDTLLKTLLETLNSSNVIIEKLNEYDISNGLYRLFQQIILNARL